MFKINKGLFLEHAVKREKQANFSSLSRCPLVFAVVSTVVSGVPSAYLRADTTINKRSKGDGEREVGKCFT